MIEIYGGGVRRSGREVCLGVEGHGRTLSEDDIWAEIKRTKEASCERWDVDGRDTGTAESGMVTARFLPVRHLGEQRPLLEARRTHQPPPPGVSGIHGPLGQFLLLPAFPAAPPASWWPCLPAVSPPHAPARPEPGVWNKPVHEPTFDGGAPQSNRDDTQVQCCLRGQHVCARAGRLGSVPASAACWLAGCVPRRKCHNLSALHSPPL